MPTYSVTADQIALVAATAKTVLQVASPATTGILVVKWWVEFDGTNAAATPVKVEVGRFGSTAATVTGATPSLVDFGQNALASQCTAGTNASAEGTGTYSAGEIHRIPPTSGMVMQDPLGLYWQVPASSWFRIRLTSATALNATVGLTWTE